MTNERAIELLHRLQDEQFDGIHGDERREALEMAVRALFSQQIVNDSQGLVNDCISRKMAIDEVKRLHDVAWANWKETRISANTMIDALKDLPSAQPERPEQPESAKEYCAECNHIEMCRWYPYEGCEFRSLPSAQPEQRWVLCSERLPEDIRPVIVTWKNTDPASYYQYIVGKHFTGTACYKNGKWYWYSSTTEDMLAEYGRYDSEEFDEAIECIAWMPLPEPFKEGEQNGSID